MLERAARGRKAAPTLGVGSCLWAATLPDGDARRGTLVARPWGGWARRNRFSLGASALGARAMTEPNELTKGCLWGGSAPPNGSRLSCGRLARQRIRR